MRQCRGDSVKRVGKGRALLVTGTDTSVGKTVVAGGLALGFRKLGMEPGVFKPAESGVTGDPPDGLFLRKCSGTKRPLKEIVPYILKEPLAPAVAAEMERVNIDMAVIQGLFRSWEQEHPVTVVEGAGGLLVPLAGTFTYADLAKLLAIPLLIVARPSLGTIKHTLLTVQAARAIGLRMLGVVISGYPQKPGAAEKTSPRVIEEMGGVEVLDLVPLIDGVSTEHSALGKMKDYRWKELASKVWDMLR